MQSADTADTKKTVVARDSIWLATVIDTINEIEDGLDELKDFPEYGLEHLAIARSYVEDYLYGR